VLTVRRYVEGEDDPTTVTLDDVGKIPDGTLVWVDTAAPSDDELTALGAHFGLHEFVLEDLRHGEQRTKLDHYADHFHVAVDRKSVV